MNKVAPSSFNFYGSLADAVLNKSASKKTTTLSSTLFPSHYESSNHKKRTHEDMKLSYKQPTREEEAPKKRLRRGADEPPEREYRKIGFDDLPKHAEKVEKVEKAEKKRHEFKEKVVKAKSKSKKGNETDSQGEESGMEDDAGGSSQDRYESDFIDDDGREEIE